jgi:hypothetical protein
MTMTDGFATHDWGLGPDYFNHEKVKTIYTILEGVGTNLWFDEEKMELDDMRNQMTLAIENTNCLVAFITERYQKKVNSMDSNDACYFEFNFACIKLSNHRIIPVVMEKSMLNQKKWKGRLAAELGNHLFVDMTEAMEKVGADPSDDALLKKKCQRIHDRVMKIKNSPFFPADASSSGEDGEKFIQLTKQLDWIQGFFDQMETKLPGTVILKMNQITDLLSSQSTTNRLLQSLDYEFIIMKIFTMKGSAAVNPSSLLASKKKDNNKKNIDIMKAFLLILSEGESELILTILTTLNHLLVRDRFIRDNNSNVSFLDFLTSCGILEIIEFLFDNLSLKSRGNKVVEFQLMSSVCRMTKLLAGNEENRNTFLEWEVLSKSAIEQGDNIGVWRLIISGRCVKELCQLIISSEASRTGSYYEWDNMDEDGLITLRDCLLDQLTDPEVTDCLLSAFVILVKDEANNEKLGSLEISQLLVKLLKQYGMDTESVGDDPKKKHEEMVIKVFEILNVVEASDRNSLFPLPQGVIEDFLTVLNYFPFARCMEPSSFSAVITKINMCFKDVLHTKLSKLSSESTADSTSCLTQEFLKLYTNLARSGLHWRTLFGFDLIFHQGLALALKVCRSDMDDLCSVLKLMQLTYNDCEPRNDIADGSDEEIDCCYINNLFDLLQLWTSNDVLFAKTKLFSYIMSHLFSMLSLSTLKYYLASSTLSAIIESENKRITNLVVQSTDAATILLLTSMLELKNRILQLYMTVNSSTKQKLLDYQPLGTTVQSLICCLEHCKCTASWTDSNDLLNLINKTVNVLSTILSICSSFNELTSESTLTSTTLASTLKCLMHTVKEFSPVAAEDNFFPVFVNGFGSRDLLVNVLKSFSLIVCDAQNQTSLIEKEFMQTFEFSSKDVALMFRSILFCYKNDIDVVECVLKIVCFSGEGDRDYILHLFFGVVVSDHDVCSCSEYTSFVRLLLHFLGSNVDNALIVVSVLSVIRTCLLHCVVLSALDEKLRSTLITIMKYYREKHSESMVSSEIMTSFFLIVKALKHLQNKSEKDTISVSFSVLEMKELGMTLKEMKDLGYSVEELKGTSLTLIQLKEADYSVKELFEGGFLLSELKEHCSLADLLSSGVIASSGVDLKNEGYSIEEVKKAGKTASEMKSYYSMDEVQNGYGLTTKALLSLGYDLVTFLKGFESSVILNPCFILDLLSLLPPTFSSTSLLYRGSRDGFDKAVYHAKCDNQGPHVTIVKCGEGNIFGGYMSVQMPAAKGGVWVDDPSNTSFLFSLKDPKGEVAKKYKYIKPKVGVDFALYSHTTDYGFCFGYYDMRSNDLKNVHFFDSSNYGVGEDKLRFTGKAVSKIAEVEVWRIVNN